MNEQELKTIYDYLDELEEKNPAQRARVGKLVEQLEAGNAPYQSYVDLMNANPVEYKTPEQPKVKVPEVSYWRDDPNYVGNLSWQQQLARADADPNWNVRNPDGSLNHERFGQYVKSEMDKATAESRRRIAHGEDLGGWFSSPMSFIHNLGGAVQNFFTPRVQESIQEGSYDGLGGFGLPGSLSDAKDFALDVGQNVLESVPYSRLLGAGAMRLTSKLAGRAGQALDKSSAFTGKVMDAFATPLATEALDAAAYDDTEHEGRGDFSYLDVLFGGATNGAAPWMLKAGANRLGRVGMMPEFGQKWFKSMGDPDMGDTYRKTLADSRRTINDSKLVGKEVWVANKPDKNGDNAVANAGIRPERKSPEEVVDAENILSVAQGIKDKRINTDKNNSLFTVMSNSDPSISLDKFGVLRNTSLPEGMSRGMYAVAPGNQRLAREIFGLPPDKLPPRNSPLNWVERNTLIASTVNDHPELLYGTIPLKEVLGGAMPITYASNKLAQENYGERGIDLVPVLGDQLIQLRKDGKKQAKERAEREYKWANGWGIPVTSADPYWEDYQEWYKRNLESLGGN